jgi:hypothetical protein
LAPIYPKHGQSEVDVELWSHPGDAAALGLPADSSRILLLARQVCLCFPLSINQGINAAAAAAAAGKEEKESKEADKAKL